MVDPFGVAAELVKGLMESLDGVKTNREDCTLLVDRANQTMELLNQVQSKMIIDQSLTKAIDFVNEALKRAQNAIEKCCKTRYFGALLLHKAHSLALHRAEKDLNHALNQIPLATVGMISGVQDDVAILVESKSHEKFEERAARTHQTNTLKNEIQKVRNQMNRGFKEATTKTDQVLEDASARTSQETEKGSRQTNQAMGAASVQTNQTMDDTRNQISQMQRLELQAKKTGALTVTTTLVKDISALSTKVKVCKQDCVLLATLAKQTLRLLEKFDDSAFANSLVLDALCQVDKALEYVKHCIDDCCSTNAFDALFLESYSSRLKESATMLGNALAKISPSFNEMSLTMKSSLTCLYNEIKNAKFNKIVEDKGNDILSEQRINFVETSQHTQKYKRPCSLQFAVMNNKIDVVKELLANGAYVNSRYEGGSSPLHIASRRGLTVVAKELIANGADVNLQDNHKCTPVFIATQNNHPDIVKVLVDSGADILLYNKDCYIPLEIAMENDYADVFKELIANGKTIDLHHRELQCLIKNALLKNCSKEVFSNVLDIDFPIYGSCALSIASIHGHVNLVKDLIAKGANVNLKDTCGQTPLYTASMFGEIEVVKELIANGAKVDLQDTDGDTPLHYAASRGHVRVAQVLLECGASKDVANIRNKKPYHVMFTEKSRRGFNRATINLLKSLLKV